MVGIRNWLAMVAAAAVCSVAGQAVATVYTVTIEGTVGPSPPEYVFLSGIDGAGLFGPAGTSLLGDPFQAEYQFDTSIGKWMDTPSALGGFGGADIGGQSPITLAELTINGITYSFSPALLGDVAVSREGSGNYYFSFDAAGPSYPFDQLSVGSGAGVFSLANFSTEGGLYPTSLTISPALTLSIPTPEPETWLILVLGAGLVGARLRTARSGPTAAAST